ncbi:MAG: DinB family protein [Thermomicrobiales bacterium]
MSETLVELCNHNAWANEQLFDACAELSDAQLDTAMTGSFGSIRATLMHIVGAQERIAKALAGPAPVTVIRDRDPFPGFAALRERARTSGEALAGAASRPHAGATVTTTWQGESFTLPVWVLLAQALTHATEHRTQIAAILTQQGIAPPGMDIWTYHEDRFNADWSRLWSG